jgi:hypothetical protein
MRSLVLPLCIWVAHAKTRGEQNGWPFPHDRALLGNVFNSGSEALKQSLSTQRLPYQDPYFDEPKTKNLDLVSRQRNRQNEFQVRNMGTSRDAHEDPAPETSSSSTKSKSKGKGMSKSKSKSTMSTKSKSKGTMSTGGGMSVTSAPTLAPTLTVTEAPTLSPTGTPTLPPTPVATDVPTCSPTTGFFPPDVSGFFQAPSGDSTDLQDKLNSALNDIQVPSEFEQQCVQR